MKVQTGSHSFGAQDLSRRRIADALQAHGIYKENAALKAEHDKSMKHCRAVVAPAFAAQFRANGKVLFEDSGYSRESGRPYENRRVINDLEPEACAPYANHVDSDILAAASDGLGRVPEHPVTRVFDLRSHDWCWVHADALTPYTYDNSLRDKIVLPDTHRDLLDILTSDLGAFVEDIVEGKSAGNVILCKGIPGVGKTLTAEVYAELIEKPLYSIHTGSMGTSAREIEKKLAEVFRRAKRWNCVLLLDEADVFVVQRGGDIEQNAVVAEFLRALEYFDGLMFMTTNRPNDIDEAIISRCAAIVDYEAPDAADAAKIWRVMATQFGADLSDSLLAELIDHFPAIAPRDIKMLFRLSLRVARGHGEELTIDVFRRCAMFRAIKMKA
jgi:hypothetical protein